MPIREWCVSTSHPIVHQITKKYNLSLSDARHIYNVARGNDIELQNDYVTMDFLEGKKAFQDAIAAYTQKFVDADDAILDRPKGDGKTTSDIREEIREELGEDVSEEEIENIVRRIDELPKHIKRSKVSTARLAAIVNGFGDARRMDFIGQWICRRLSSYMSMVEHDATVREHFGIPQKPRRQDYYTDDNVKTLIKKKVLHEMKNAMEDCAEFGEEKLAQELKLAREYFDTLMFMYGGNFFRSEGVFFDMNGDMHVSEEDSSSNSRNDIDAREEDDEEGSDEDMGEQPTGGFTASDQNKSVSSKIQGPIKILLSNLKMVDRKGEEVLDEFGYGLPTYVSISQATNKILSICKGCETFSEMFKALKRRQNSIPWLRNLVTALDETQTFDESGLVKSSSSKKEQLQSQFFQSFRKQFTKFRHSYPQTDADGNLYFVNADSNVSHRAERMLDKVRRLYSDFAGAEIFSEGIIQFNRLKTILGRLSIPPGSHVSAGDYSSVESTMYSAGFIANDIARKAALDGKKGEFKQAMDKLAEAEERIRKDVLSAIGIEVPDALMNEYMSGSSNANTLESVFGNNANFGSEEFADRYINLKNLISAADSLIKELQAWGNAQGRGETSDNPRTNPFERRKGMKSDYEGIYRLRNKFMNVINLLCSESPDSFESFAHINGKDYYSWNNPSSILTIVEKLTHPDRERVKEYIRKKYGQDTLWFVKPGGEDGELHFYSEILEEIYNGNGGKIFDYSEKPMFCGDDYNKLSDGEYAMSMLQDYFGKISIEQNTAWYRMLIAGDKPRYSSIKWRKYNSNDINVDGSYAEENYHNVIARKAIDFFAQEVRRANEVIRHALTNDMKIDVYDPKVEGKIKDVIDKIKRKERITRDDLLENGRYIFRNSGASFYLNKFLNDEIEDRTSELGTYVIDKVFNSIISEREEMVVDTDTMKSFKSAFHEYMRKTKMEFFDKLNDIGVLEVGIKSTKNESTGKSEKIIFAKNILGSLLQWHADDPNFVNNMYDMDEEMYEIASHLDIDVARNEDLQAYLYQLAAFSQDIEEFVYNNWLVKANASEVFDVDLAFYGTTPNFQKRNAQVISSGYVTDPEAKIHGEPVSDGKYRSITIKTDKKNVSKHLYNIEAALRKAADTISDPMQKKRYLESMKDTLKKLDGFDATDGQGLSSLTSLRKKMAGQGEWSRSDTKELDMRGVDENGNHIYTHEAVYQRWRRGETTTDDLMFVFAQAQKPFVYSAVDYKRKGRGTITVPTQHKNSEYALCFLSAFGTSEPKTTMEAISRFMEETATEEWVNPDTGQKEKRAGKRGIDTVNFDSCVKIGGNSRVIDISGMTPQKALQTLREAVYGKKETVDENGVKQYVQGVVTEYDNTDYKIQQQKNEHFKHSAQPMGSQIKILAINNIADTSQLTLPSGKQISGKELKTRYFAALKRKMAGVEAEFRENLGLNLPHEKRLHRLSNTLKTAMSTDQKFGVEMRHALSITERNGESQFVLPLDEPGQQSAVEAMLYSKIRRTYYKQKTNGGIVVQATSWDASDDLHIRFGSSNPEDTDGLLKTKEQFAKEKGLKGAKLDSAYKAYVDEYQTGYAHFEAEVPMPGYIRDMLLKEDPTMKRFLNPDGTWNMDEIHKVVPDSAFDAICYRVPTEAKYSIMVCRIVRFSPEASGSVAKYPQELTVFTGSDFDIDTDTIELRPIPGSQGEREDNELFDLQMAALRSNQGLLETFKSGDFSDLSEMSYYMTLLETGDYSVSELNSMSSKELKTLCEQHEDLDLMNPVTDIVLHNQNSDASDMIAIAAVGVTSHAFLSLYNDIDKSDPQRDPDQHPENFIRIRFNEGNPKLNNESFTVINDRNQEETTIKEIKGSNVILDPIYDMDGNLIGTQISKYVGGSADAAKDAALYRLNITRETLPILIFMHRIGVSSDVAKAFISQPVVKQVVKQLGIQSSFSNYGYRSIDNAIDEVIYQLKDAYINIGANDNEKARLSAEFDRINESAKTTDKLTLRFSELVDNKAHPKEQSLTSKLQQLHLLRVLYKKSSKVKNLDTFSRYNSSSAMRGTSFIDRYAMRNKIEKLKGNLEPASEDSEPLIQLPANVEIMDGFPPTNFGKLCSMFPYIGATIQGETQMVDDIILENMKTYNEGFFTAVKRLGIEDKADAMKALYAGWKNYLLFVGPNRIADFWNEDVVKFYTRDFAEKYYFPKLDEIKARDEKFYNDFVLKNSFIDLIAVSPSKEGYDAFTMLKTHTVGLSGAELEKFKKDWASLLEHHETRELAINTAIHFLARSAAFSRDTPVHLIPLAVQEAIPHYMDAFSMAKKVSMTENDMLQFLTAVCLNNPDNWSIMPHITRKAQTEYVAATKDTLPKLIFSKEKFNGGWLRQDGDQLAFRTPVIHVTSDVFPNGQLFITGDEITEEKMPDGKIRLSVEAVPVTPLGIPYQMSEYTGLDMSTSIFRTGENNVLNPDGSIPEEYRISAPAFEEDNDFFEGRRVGTFLEDAPYGEIDNGTVEKYLAESESDRSEVQQEGKEKKESAYLESRLFLKRARKLAGILGFTTDTVNRGYENGSPSYSINIAPTGYNVDQHSEAIKAAALLTTLGNIRKGQTTVKTYSSLHADENGEPDLQGNGVEFSIPLNKSAREKEAQEWIISSLNHLGIRYYLSTDSDELQFTVGIDEGSENPKGRLYAAMNDIRRVFSELKRRGYSDATSIEANYIQQTELSEDDIDNALNEIRDEADSKQESVGQDQQASRSNRRNKNWQPVGIGYLADLAIRKREGENVREEIDNLFGERSFPLHNATASFESRQVVNSVIDSMEDSVRAATHAMLTDVRKSGDKLTQSALFDRLIINTANWIIGHRSQDQLSEMIQKVGASEETSRSIISVVEQVLEDLDIC